MKSFLGGLKKNKRNSLDVLGIRVVVIPGRWSWLQGDPKGFGDADTLLVLVWELVTWIC